MFLTLALPGASDNPQPESLHVRLRTVHLPVAAKAQCQDLSGDGWRQLWTETAAAGRAGCDVPPRYFGPT